MPPPPDDSRPGWPVGTASRFKEETYTYITKLRSIREDLLALEKKRPANNGPGRAR